MKDINKLKIHNIAHKLISNVFFFLGKNTDLPKINIRKFEYLVFSKKFKMN